MAKYSSDYCYMFVGGLVHHAECCPNYNKDVEVNHGCVPFVPMKRKKKKK